MSAGRHCSFTWSHLYVWPLVTSAEPELNSVANPEIFPLPRAAWPLVSLPASLFYSLTDYTRNILLHFVNSAVNKLELLIFPGVYPLIRVPKFHNRMENDFDSRDFFLCVNYWRFPFWILNSFFIPDTEVGPDLLSKFVLHCTLPSL